MQTYLKTKPVWSQLLLFMGMAFGLFMICSLFGAMLLSKVTGISIEQVQDVKNWDPNNTNMIFYVRSLLLIQFLSLFAIPSFLFSYFSDPQPLQYLRIQKPIKSIYWLLAVTALVIAIPFVDLMGWVNQKIAFGDAQQWMKTMEEDAARQIQFMLNKHTVGELIINIFFIAVLAGIGEELFFRGILQRMFIKVCRHPWQGIIITAALFSAFHLQFFGFIPRFLLGIVLGAIYWYSGSLLTAMLAHTVYNALMIVIVYLNPEMLKNLDATVMQQTTMQMIITGIISLLLLIAVLWQMKKLSSVTFESVYKNDNALTEEPH
ncbi:MAG TPA: CPBP family intramembrane glutamic endopeptidase [Flavisolibacter sp.]|nr:CPBP family intramembrane glutamic endopeptidase [Flavisolibacter sp.]